MKLVTFYVLLALCLTAQAQQQSLTLGIGFIEIPYVEDQSLTADAIKQGVILARRNIEVYHSLTRDQKFAFNKNTVRQVHELLKLTEIVVNSYRLLIKDKQVNLSKAMGEISNLSFIMLFLSPSVELRSDCNKVFVNTNEALRTAHRELVIKKITVDEFFNNANKIVVDAKTEATQKACKFN